MLAARDHAFLLEFLPNGGDEAIASNNNRNSLLWNIIGTNYSSIALILVTTCTSYYIITYINFGLSTLIRNLWETCLPLFTNNDWLRISLYDSDLTSCQIMRIRTRWGERERVCSRICIIRTRWPREWEILRLILPHTPKRSYSRNVVNYIVFFYFTNLFFFHHLSQKIMRVILTMIDKNLPFITFSPPSIMYKYVSNTIRIT